MIKAIHIEVALIGLIVLVSYANAGLAVLRAVSGVLS